MKANAVSRLLSSLVWIDQYNECNQLTALIIFAKIHFLVNIRKGVFHEIKRDGRTSFHGIHDARLMWPCLLQRMVLFQESMDDSQHSLAEVEKERTRWTPVEDVMLESLQDEISATKVHMLFSWLFLVKSFLCCFSSLVMPCMWGQLSNAKDA